MKHRKHKKLLIIECIPKKAPFNEWIVLTEFLRMSVEPKDVHSIRRLSKQSLIGYLKHKVDLVDYDFVHLSGHGNADKGIFCTPKGDMTPEDFPKDCFEGKTITLSSCTLGKEKFIRRFMNHTGARIAIAPVKQVLFVDSALWFTTYYYNALHRGMKPMGAYDRTEHMLDGVKGGFACWRP